MNNLTPIIIARDLTVGYDRTPILSGINFSIYPGDMICLMGHNGCGKTTILRTLSKLLNKGFGEIHIKGKEVDDWNESDYAKVLSVVLTEKIENQNITVKELVELGRYPYTGFMGVLKDIDRKVINESIELLGIEELVNKKISELSDGQRQKVFIARALAQETEVLLLDEPTTFLDLPGKMEVLKILKKIAHEKKVAVLFSSHDWQLILELASWIWLIDKKGSLKAGIPEDFILSGDFEKCFNHKDFTFDDQIGFFKENRIDEKDICLVGGEYKTRVWTEHLLRKESFNVINKEQPNVPLINIITDNGEACWKLTQNAESIIIKSLENLIVRLKQH